MENLPLHPAIIHFPIALFIVIGIIGIISLFTEELFLKRMIFWLFIIAIAFTAASIFTGLEEETSIAHNEAIHEILEKHEANGFLAAGFFVLMFLWFWLRKRITNKTEYTLWTVLIIAGCILLGYQNYLGGEMVYKHGAGVEPMEQIINQKTEDKYTH